MRRQVLPVSDASHREKGYSLEEEKRRTHLVFTQQLESCLELAVVERPDNFPQVRLEVEELSEIRVLEDASAELRAVEAGERGDDGVEGDVGRRDELRESGEDRVSMRAEGEGKRRRKAVVDRRLWKGNEGSKGEERGKEKTNMSRSIHQRLTPNSRKRHRRLIVRPRSEESHSARNRQPLQHDLPLPLLLRLDRILRRRDHAGKVDRRGLVFRGGRGGGEGGFDGGFGFDDVVADEGVVGHVERDLCGVTSRRTLVSTLRKEEEEKAARATHLDDSQAHLENVLARRAELATLRVAPDRPLEISDAVLEAGEVAVTHLRIFEKMTRGTGRRRMELWDKGEGAGRVDGEGTDQVSKRVLQAEEDEVGKERTRIDSLIKLVTYPLSSTSSLSCPLCASLLALSIHSRSTLSSLPSAFACCTQLTAVESCSSPDSTARMALR